MVVVVDCNAPAAHVARHKWQPNTPDGQGSPFLFQNGKAISDSASGTIVRMFKGPTGTGEQWQFPQALAFGVSGIRSQAIVSVTCDKEIITGKCRPARIVLTCYITCSIRLGEMVYKMKPFTVTCKT